MGRLMPDGSLSFSGRVSEMIKKSGINISPAEVEDVLMRHPAVALAGVVGVPDARQGELLAAFVVPKPGRTIRPEDTGGALPRSRLALQGAGLHRGARHAAGDGDRQADAAGPEADRGVAGRGGVP